jgi:hypothetical protein
MMRLLGLSLLAGLLCGCQTPTEVRDMSTLATKFATQMDGTVTTYVAALNANNDSDVPRLQSEISEAARLNAANADEAAVWKLMSGSQAANVNRLLASISSMSVDDLNPLTGATNSISTNLPQGKITFDSTPLKTIETVAGGIAKPKTLSDQLSIISAYAKTVQSDLKSATAAANTAAEQK